MSGLDLDAIRERLAKGSRELGDNEIERLGSCRQDIHALLAEVERLQQQEIQREAQISERHNEYIRQLEQESDDARAEVAELKARLTAVDEIV